MFTQLGRVERHDAFEVCVQYLQDSFFNSNLFLVRSPNSQKSYIPSTRSPPTLQVEIAMPSVPTPAPGTTSGIITSDTGERHIPSSLRSDGTKRKEIRIRPGYKPPEDVEVYKNRTAESWKNRGSGGIPGAMPADIGSVNGDSKASNKNAKRKEARKKAKASGDGTPAQPISNSYVNDLAQIVSSSNLEEKNNRQAQPTEKERELDPEAEKEKLARNLKKKLRQARELREKKDKGDSLLPEQFEKVIKINELIRQLDSLGFDAEGEPKDTKDADPSP